jgi:hypothetical protein
VLEEEVEARKQVTSRLAAGDPALQRRAGEQIPLLQLRTTEQQGPREVGSGLLSPMGQFLEIRSASKSTRSTCWRIRWSSSASTWNGPQVGQMSVGLISRSRVAVSLNTSLQFGQPIDSFMFRFKVLMRRIFITPKSDRPKVAHYREVSWLHSVSAPQAAPPPGRRKQPDAEKRTTRAYYLKQTVSHSMHSMLLTRCSRAVGRCGPGKHSASTFVPSIKTSAPWRLCRKPSAESFRTT